MIEDALSTLNENGYLFAAAPTGIGKTAAALSATLARANNHPNGRKTVLFMTGRQSQHRIVVDTVRKINARMEGQKVRLVDLIGRESMCVDVDRFTGRCNCEFGVNDSILHDAREGLKRYILEAPRHVDDVIKQGKERKVCSWTCARQCAKECDLIVLDYNHVFIDKVREASLDSMGVELSNSILIVDEAHNLPDRIRRGLERRLTAKVLRDCVSEMQEHRGKEDEAVVKAVEKEGAEAWT